MGRAGRYIASADVACLEKPGVRSIGTQLEVYDAVWSFDVLPPRQQDREIGPSPRGHRPPALFIGKSLRAINDIIKGYYGHPLPSHNSGSYIILHRRDTYSYK
jgi:hypothetical protein